jgi:hypothetical protein
MLLVFHSQLRHELASQRDRIPFDIRPDRISIFSANINTFIAPIALRLVKKQWQIALSESYRPVCSSAFERVHGLLCCHTIRERLDLNPRFYIEAADFDPHWWFERPINHGPALRLPSPVAPHSTVEEPSIVRARGRPRRDDTDKTTRRDPSQWELPVARRPRASGPSGASGPASGASGAAGASGASGAAGPAGPAGPASRPKGRPGREAQRDTTLASIASSMEALVQRLAPSVPLAVVTTTTMRETIYQTTRETTYQRSGRATDIEDYIDIDQLVAYDVPETLDLTHQPPTPEKPASKRRRWGEN